ncbi:MAG: glycosyl hydrolase [Verrucomicrobia bacterium CG_4_10_14_3_um_filter_43_23]|nr:MAG: hypothetical protein AUJ82_04285 [Verrucomicrobia bacterium CG1_02_43_26]PIP59082.1 MAG: glycosyl hydrolase [Verrucomicrobia bacterium CG22_combo_CG10-13_8_21_14_all_43_17]PIX58219.1 MAG: glycosyl hydrolase [Verrucomicrobia bacterium CG_4_10_14_3_um_filter_43_23]PIY61296.1 MAG: glycosyl hydrolase [Verrucomicrobia bacterium CG_4_10_14_0_8_um_filter_43_34]PJA43390.1 MAG: glycosyl hydrolase [Verrucomicrobia bacterium CG_4_9_14_3_um_filter_43_20]
MDFLLNIFFFVFGLWSFVFTLYLFLVTVGAYFFRRRSDPTKPPLKLAVVIPAYNEAREIEKVIQSIKDSYYPINKFRIIVLADNCTDRTAEVSRQAGAEVVERDDPLNPGKGQALDWLFTAKKDIFAEEEAIILIDADAVVDPYFLSQMSSSLSAEGVKIVQSFNGVSNPISSWRTSLSVIAFDLVNYIRLKGRNFLGGTAGPKGNGVGFSKEVVLKSGWPAKSIVEDLEFSLLLLDEGVKVQFNPLAKVYSEMAVFMSQAQAQRMRWEGGRWHLIRSECFVLLKKFICSGKWAYLEAWLDLLFPPLTIWLLLNFGLLILAFIASSFAVKIFLTALIVSGFYVLSGLILRRAPLHVWGHLFVAPVFILWKIPLYFKILFGKVGHKWERTQRKSEFHDSKK